MPDKPTAYFLPTAPELAILSDAKVAEIVRAADNLNRREHSYAVFGMACGTFSLIASLGVYDYMVHDLHFKAGLAVLGTGVLTTIGQIITARLNR